MFNIDYSRSAEKSVVDEKTRQPVTGNMGLDMQPAEQCETETDARCHRPRPHKLPDDAVQVEENEFY